MTPLDVWPLELWVIVTSYYRTSHRPGHRGVDYGHPIPGSHVINGTMIRAPFDGYLSTGFEHGGAGNWVNVQRSDGLLFKCFHLSAYASINGTLLRSGQVKAGDLIGFVGTTGSSTAPHAHMELWQAGRDFDPFPMFDAAQRKANRPPDPPKDWLEMATIEEVEAVVRKVVQEEILNQDARIKATLGAQQTLILDQLDPRREAGVEVTPARDLLEAIHGFTKPAD